MPPVVVFATTSDIEASVVLALLDSQGISGFRITGNPQAILPMSMSPLGEVRIAVHEDSADDAKRIIASHREDRSEEHTSELQSPCNLVCRLLLEKKKNRAHILL